MNLWQEKSVVSKLRIKGENLDPLAARLHFERLFAASNPIPEGFPPKAIICIKKLRDPAPQTLRLNRSDFRLSDAWQTAVKREIEKLYSRAFRPISETIPAQAESIIFADRFGTSRVSGKRLVRRSFGAKMVVAKSFSEFESS